MRLQKSTALSPDPEPPAVARGLRRRVFLTLGWFFLGLAILGAILPLLPTTPFLLLASFFFARSSRRWNEKLLSSRLLGPLLRDWHKRRGVRLHVKITAIAMMLLSISASVAFGNLPPLAVVFLVGGGTVGFVVILRLPVVSDDAGDEPVAILRVPDFEEAA